jgi:hypothetical protein
VLADLLGPEHRLATTEDHYSFGTIWEASPQPARITAITMKQGSRAGTPGALLVAKLGNVVLADTLQAIRSKRWPAAASSWLPQLRINGLTAGCADETTASMRRATPPRRFLRMAPRPPLLHSRRPTLNSTTALALAREQTRYDRGARRPHNRIDVGAVAGRRRALARPRQAIHPKRECRRRRPA